MWRADPGRTVDYWRDYLRRCEAELKAALEGLPDEPADARPVMVGGQIFTLIENLEIAQNNIELFEGTGSYEDAGWIRGKLGVAEGRLEALMREIEAAPEGWARWRAMARVQGTRKLVRKWKEELAFLLMCRQRDQVADGGDRAEAMAIFADWYRWHRRPDRKDFDGPALLDPEADAMWRAAQESARVAWAAKQAAGGAASEAAG